MKLRQLITTLILAVGFTATADTRFTYAPNYTWKTPTSVALFHNGTYIPFDPTTEEDLPGSSPAWQVFASNQKQYTAPGAVMRYIEGYRQSSDAQFAPLTFGGMLVEEGATGYAITGSSGDNRFTELGDKRATGGVPTWFVYNEDFSFNRTGTFTLYGDINFDVAEEKVVDLNSAQTSRVVTLDPGTSTKLRMNGAGQIKVTTLVATGAVTLDYSALEMTQTSLYIDGNLTCDASTKFAFPADFEEGITLQLCTGTLSGLEDQSVHEITIGEKTAFARLSVDDNSISFAWVEDNKATVGGYTKWSEIQWEGEYIPGLPVDLTLTADAEIDFDTEDVTIPGLTLKGGYEAILCYTITPTIGVINLEDGATVVHKFPLTEERTEALTVPAGQTYILVGGEEEAITCSGKITVNGTLKTEGKLNFSNGGNVVPAGGELIAKGELTLKGADRGLSGTLTIEAGAKLTAASGDFMNYNANQSPVLNIKGTLDFSTYRWTIGASSTPTVNMYTGGQVVGTGDTVGAFHVYAVNYWNVIKTDGEDTFTVSAPTPLQSNPTIDVQAGATLDFTGRVYCPYGGKTITLAGEGTTRFSGEYTGALTVEEDGQVKLTGEAKPSSISGAGSVTIASVAGTATNTSDVANFTGTITVDASVTTLVLGTSRPECDFVFSGATTVVYTENVSDDGVVQQLNVISGTAPTYKVMGVDGTEKTITEGTYTPTVTGKAALYAWEFNGNLASVGQDTGTMGKDHGPFYTDDNEAVYAYSQPYYNVSWPTEFTTMIACTLPTNANVCLVGWGKASPGGIALISGDVSKNEVKMVAWQNNQQYTVLASMTVPNASTCEHLDLVTKTADSIKVYLDGALAASYSGELTLGLGIQVGTVYQGIGNTGLIRLVDVYSGTNTCKAVIDSLRIYKTVLGPNAIAQLVDEFPYVSPNGAFTRDLAGTDNQWVAADAWTKVGPETTHAAPDAGSTVNLSAEEEATITLNLEKPVNYEALSLTGDGAITIAAAAANENKISSSGLVKIGSDATIEYSAMSLAGTAIEVAAEKTLTVDCSMIDLSQYYATTTIPLTGLVTGDGELAFEVPEKVSGRLAEAQFNELNNTWELKITVISASFIYDGGAWTWNSGAVTPETVSNHTELAVTVRSGTLEWPMDRASFEVQGGTLKAATAPTVPCTVEVTQEGATFDLNGIAPTGEANNFTVTMAGGKLTNSSEAQGLVKSLTITAESTVDTSVGTIAIQNYKGGWGATTLTLDAHSLYKTGTNRLEFVSTTVMSDGGSIEVEAGTIWTQENSNFGDAKIHISTSGAFEVRSGVTATVQTINGDGEGAKIIVHGTISAFTLEDTATIAGEGTFGTITLEDDGTLYVGEKRGLTLEGNGTVDAQLTLVEMAAAEPLTLFTTTEGEFDVVLTDYNGRDLEAGEDYTIEGGVVTPTAIPFIYSDGWLWNDDEVEASTVAAVPAGAIIVEDGTCEWNIDRDITVDGGTLKATGTKKANAAITVNEEGTFDVNGKENTEWTVLLKGGSLVNNGGAIGHTKKQIKQLTVEEYDSTVDAAANFGLIANSWGANTLDLGGKKLTKTGAATFWLASTTVTDGTFEVAEGTLEVTGNADSHVTTFADNASLVLDAGTTLAVARPLTIGAIEVKGATINNAKSITAFSLKGEATLAGNGTWGTITLDSDEVDTTINVGNLRGFTLAGDGDVDVHLTAAEESQYEPIVVFTSESEDVVIDDVYDHNGTHLVIDEDYTVEGGSITMVDKRIAVESVTLSETTKTLKVGETFQLTATVSPEGAYIASKVWASEDPLIAMVDDVGNVEAISVGTTNITVTVKDHLNNTFVATCVVTVQNAIEPIDPSAGGEIKCDTPQAATNLAEAITANPAAYVKAPEGVTGADVAKYQEMFKASVSGKTVTLELTEAATSNLLEQVEADVKSAAADLTSATTTSTTLTNVTPGMYYWIKGATDINAAWKDGDAVKAGSDKSVELTKPTFQGTQSKSFFKISVDFKAPSTNQGAVI